MNKNKDIDTVKKIYKNKLRRINKNVSNLKDTPVEYLVEALRFLRDYFSVTLPLINKDGTENYVITSIHTAICEWEDYNSCIHKYYKYADGKLERKIQGTAEEVGKKFNDELNRHWNNFWTIVADNMGGWLEYAGLWKDKA